MDRERMLEYMPHRGRNVLIDEYEDTGPGAGRGRLTIAEGDPAGRDVFLERRAGGLCYSPFFLVEHAALTSILVLRSEMGGGRLAYFSTVSKFRSHGDAPAGVPVVSTLTRARDRGEFRNFAARVETEAGALVAEASFMAFLAPRDRAPEAGPPRPGEVTFPPPAADLFPGLDPALAFLSRSEGGEWGGVYPATHPLAEGHFPGAPVMMGMTQWLAVAERAAIEAPVGRTEVRGDGALLLADGAPVVEVTGLAIEVDKDAAGRIADLRLLSTKRVAFRERIHPGDAYTVTTSGSV
jgi:3-hydroxymyristoyl/3-hydroxydecanoyl-(acyl carrier protein) dehydratase